MRSYTIMKLHIGQINVYCSLMCFFKVLACFINRDLNKALDGQKNYTEAKSSPRSRYLREVAHQKLPPLSLLMRKQHVRIIFIYSF